MAMATGRTGTGGGRRRRTKRTMAPMAEINMTPFIDVMLVLLIVFMIAAPLLTVGVPLDLPQTKAGPINIDQKPLTVSIDEKGRVYLQEKEIQPAEITAALAGTARQGFDERIYVRGAKSVGYGRVMEIMAVITKAGYKRVAMITEPEK